MRWKPNPNPSQEKAVAERLRRSSKFYLFLWSVREELFDDDFQEQLIAAYAPRGQEPCPPTMVAMATLLQRYAGLGAHPPPRGPPRLSHRVRHERA